MHIKKRIWVGIVVSIFALAICDSAPADNATQPPLTPRAAADAFLHRAELLRVKYKASNRPQQALQDLTAEKYDALEAELNSAEGDFERDPAYELALYDVLHAIAGVDCTSSSPELGQLIKAWVDARPKSAWSHLMLGQYDFLAGCQARGTGWSKDVTDEQQAKMSELHDQARAELLKAEQIEPKHLAIYTSRLNLSKFDSDPDGMAQAYEDGRKLFPASFNLPGGFMDGLMPRWYGNYEVMGRLADSLKTQTQLNPLFWVLQGATEADQGNLTIGDADSSIAFLHYQNALRYGDQAQWLLEMGYLEMKMKDWGSALQYYHRDELYDIPLSSANESDESRLASYCNANPGNCKTDPKSFPWYGEPELSENTPAN